jgi:DNA-binding NarL/FixJ family response regulator
MKLAQGKNGTIKIVLVDDHAIVRQGIALLINSQPEMMVVGEAEDAPNALTEVARLKPDMVIVDITLKKGDGLELIKTIRAQYRDMAIIVLSMHEESLYAQSVLRAGAMGYVMKDQNIIKLIDAIHQVLNRRIYLSPDMMYMLVYDQISGRSDSGKSPVENFSDREKQVFRLIAQWRRPNEIAKDLNLSIKTVDYYRARLKEKLNLNSVAQLTRYATEFWQREESNLEAPPPVRKGGQLVGRK